MSDSGKVWGAGSDEEIIAVNTRRMKARLRTLGRRLRNGTTISIKPWEWNEFIDSFHEQFGQGNRVWRCVFTVGKIEITDIG